MPRLFLIEEEYRLALLDAKSSFAERFIGQITDPETGWGPLWAAFHGEPVPTGGGPHGDSAPGGDRQP